MKLLGNRSIRIRSFGIAAKERNDGRRINTIRMDCMACCAPSSEWAIN